MERSKQYTQEALAEQIFWLIQLRWIAVVGLFGAALAGNYVFPVLISPVPFYICAGVLLLCNILYFFVATRKAGDVGTKDVVWGMIQVETDIFILTAVLHFSGGVVNPFFLFYVFHVIIAAIILPSTKLWKKTCEIGLNR